MRFLQAYKSTYSAGLAFVIACPLLALIPVVFELIQHLVEVKLGIYQSIDAAKALERHPLRMASGCLKVAALTLPGYWVIRFIVERNPSRAGKIERMPARLFARYFAFMFFLALFQLFGLPQNGVVQITAFLLSIAVTVLVAPWAVAAPLGNESVGLRKSVSIMLRHLPWGMAFYIAAFLPLVIPHYALGALALMGPTYLLWPALILDSLLVGYLAAVMSALSFYVAQHGAAPAEVQLHAATPA